MNLYNEKQIDEMVDKVIIYKTYNTDKCDGCGSIQSRYALIPKIKRVTQGRVYFLYCKNCISEIL